MTQNPWRILIVDDEPNNLELMGQILKGQYKLSVAINGLKALELAGRLQPDMILLDVMMPGMDGFETCRRLKADPSTSRIPVIFVSALSDIEDEQEGFAAGGVDYIAKPVSAPIVQARVATHLSLSYQNRILEETVDIRTRELQQALDNLREASRDTIQRLVKAAEYKDSDTGIHVLRMSDYCAAIARHMGKTPEEAETFRVASTLHDIGKIGIPDRILLKPDKLTPGEWEIMKSHTTIGGKILGGSNAEFIRLCATIALSHHEKWDGSGYPGGLKGDRIPEVGRMVAIADVFDALTTRRPYKEPFSLERSFDILRRDRGTHFDPDVVDAFFDIESQILDIREYYNRQEALGDPEVMPARYAFND